MPALLRLLFKVLAWVTIALAVVATTVRLTTPFLNDYREQLAALLAAQLDTTVEIGRIRASWVGWGPRISLHKVSLGEGEEATTALRVDFALEPGAILRGRARLEDSMRMTIEGLRMRLVREPGGQLHIQGLGTFDTGGGEVVSGTVPVPNHLQLSDTQLVWEDRMAHKAPMDIGRIDIDLRRDGTRLRLRAALQGSTGRAEMAADLNGFLTRTDWFGETYLRLEDMNVARILEQYLPPGYDLDSLGLDLEVWSTWEDAVAIDNIGHIETRDLALTTTNGTVHAVQLPLVSSDYRFQRGQDGLTLVANNLRVQHSEGSWPTSRFAVDMRREGDALHVRSAADFLRLQDVLEILRIRFPWAGVEQWVSVMQPAGDLHDLRLDLNLHGEQFDWRGALGFERLSLNAHRGIPGFSGISGQATGNPEHLAFAFDTRDATLDMAGMFREVLRLQALEGRVDLSRATDTEWELRSDALRAVTPHLATLSRVRVNKPVGQPVQLDIQTDFQEGQGEHAPLYYPLTVMNPALVNWLEKSIRAGHVTAGTFLLHGPLPDFPFDKTRNGVFEVDFEVEDLELDYQAGWPVLQDATAHARFHQNSLDLAVSQGRIGGARVVNAGGGIRSLDPPGPVAIRSRLRGDLPDMLRGLDAPALGERFGHITAALDTRGRARLDLDFAVPIDKGRPYLEGALYFDDARVALKNWDLAVSNIQGRLAFDLNSVSAIALQGKALGSDIMVDVLPLSMGTTRIITYGEFGTAAIRRQLPWLPLDRASGESEFVVKVDLPDADQLYTTPIMLTVQSDLDGIAIDLPAPLDKPAHTEVPLTLEIPMGVEAQPLALNFGDKVSGLFTTDGKRGILYFGDGVPELQKRESIQLRGHLPSLDLSQWKALLEAYPGATDSRLPPLDADVTLDRLTYEGLKLDKVSLKLKQAGRAMQGSIFSEIMAGEFVLPADTRRNPLRIDLQRLHLKMATGDDVEDGNTVATIPNPEEGPDPRRLPPLEVHCRNLQLNQAKLGELRLRTRHTERGLAIEQLALSGGEATLDSTGGWTYDGSTHRTELSGTLASASLGDLLNHLGYRRQIDKSTGQIDFDMSWPGNPVQARAGTIEALAEVNISEGRLLDVDPGVTRIVGLLNFNALNRRLRLDFTDLVQDGFAFDEISGTFDIEDGNAYTNNLRLEGPSGRILVGGRTGLVDRDFDQQVSVTPRFDATLPIAGTLTGGPIAGLVLLVAQTAMKQQVDRINRIEYSVIGPWSDPEITRIEGGGPLSQLMEDGDETDGNASSTIALPSSDNTPGL